MIIVHVTLELCLIEPKNEKEFLIFESKVKSSSSEDYKKDKQ